MQFYVMREPAPSDLLFALWVSLHLFLFFTYLFPYRHSLGIFIVIHALPILTFPYDINYALITLYGFLTFVVFSEWSRSLTKNHLKMLFEVGMWVNVVAVIIYVAMTQLNVSFSDQFNYYNRLKGLFKDPNVFASFLLLPFYWVVFTFKSSYYWRVFPLLIIVIAIVLSGSRVALVCLLLPVLWMWNKLSFTTKGLLLGTLVVSGFLLAIITDRYTLHAYDLERFAVQLEALQHALHYPLGIGAGESEQLLGHSPHQTYLRILLENGILGLLGYLIAIFLLVKRLWGNPDPLAQTLFVALISILIMNIVIDTLHWRHSWLWAGLAWSIGGERYPNRIHDYTLPAYRRRTANRSPTRRRIFQ